MSDAKPVDVESLVDDLVRGAQLEPICGTRQLQEKRTALVNLLRGGAVVAWARVDDGADIISHKRKAAGEAAGGVAARQVAPYSVPLVHRPV